MQTKTASCGKRLLAVVLAVLMVCSLLPTAVFAEEVPAGGEESTTPSYELRVLTFEDADYKGGTNFAGGTNWSSLIDEPQYGGKLLYGTSGQGVNTEEEAYKWTDADNTMLSHTLPNNYNSYCYWGGGHAVSNYVSGDSSTYGNSNSQLTVYKKGVSSLERTGGGHNGSNNFAVHYGYIDASEYNKTTILPALSFSDGKARVIDHMYVNTTTYLLNCMLNGNAYTDKIGNDDWIKLTAVGYGADGNVTATTDMYLCDGPDKIVMDWTKWDLTPLGKVVKVGFNISGSSRNEYGFSQPAYFAYDDVAVRFEKEAPSAPPVTVKAGDEALTLTSFEGGSDSFADEYYTLSAPYGSSLTVCVPDAAEIITYDIHGDDFYNGEENAVTLTAERLNTLLIDAGNLEALHATAFQLQPGSKAAFLSVMNSEIGKKYGLLIELTEDPNPPAPPVTVKAGDEALTLTSFEGGSDSFADEYYTLSAPYGSSLTVCVPDAAEIITYDIHGDDFYNGEENAVTLTAERLNTLLIDAGNLEALHATAFQPQAGSKAAFLSVMNAEIGKKYGLLIELTNLPRLREGVTDTEATVQTGKSYQLDDLMDGKIFDVAEGELTYKNYFYTMSSDGGATWGAEQGFEEALFGGVNKSLVQNTAGDYLYKFYARNEAGTSAKTWTLTLHVRDSVTANVNFYVGQDQNYKTNGNVYPKLELYKTAGIDEKQFDYVGWFTNAEGKTEYVYNPADYTIIEGETDYVEVNGTRYELHDYEKLAFTNSAFDAADETATASGTVVDKYNMFYATLSTGRYSTRGYGWNAETKAYDIYLGGQSLPLPMEKDIYGGGGNDIYLGIVSCYTYSKKVDKTYFGVDDYTVEMIMPVTGSMIHAGTPYTYDTDYTAFPFLSWEAGNASLYNIYAYPTDTEHYAFNQMINQTTNKTFNVTTKRISISGAVVLTVNAPTDAEFGLYFQYNNFNTKPVEPFETAVNAESGMTTYRYRVSKSNSNYTWRLTDPTGARVTKAGWVPSCSADAEKTYTFAADAPTDKKSHDFSKLGTTVSSRDEADLQVFLSHSGFKSVTDTYRVRAYRMWQLIDSDTANIMAEPKFNVQVLQGNDADIKQVNGGNAEGNWIDVKPTGTDIVAVTYDAIDMYAATDTYKTHGGMFPANNPERTGVFVITNEAAGKADAVIRFNGGTISNRGAEWDYNYDTWYYLDTDEAPTLDFTTTKGATASYAVVTTDAALNSTLSGWTELTADENGTFHASLLPFRTAKTLGGTVILKLTDSTGTSYRLARVAQMSVTVKNASNSGEPIMPGDKVTLSFDGLYRGMDKVSGIFNPLQLSLNYSTDEDESMGSLGQYQQMDRASVTVEMPTDITFPEGSDKTTVMVTDGYISGGMYAAISPFDTLYGMTDTGVGTNFSAASISFVASRLADIPVEVNTKVYYNVKLVPVDEAGNAIDGLTPTLADGSNKAVTAEADGTFKVGYGSYSYAVEQLGYVRTTGSFKLGSADAAKVENGVLTIKFTVRKAAENAWDGKTATEPKTDDNGVYLIGTGAELAWFAQKVNAGSTKISGILTADIDLAGYEWTPIGSISKNFAGTFDGRNHTVDNLSINYSSTTTVSLYRGLFGWVNGTESARAKIENLTVNGTVVAGSSKPVNDAYVGGIVGRADYADLTNLHSNVDVSIKRTAGNYWQSVGGVVGGTYYSLNVTNCSNSGNVTGWRYCAGIVGNIASGYQPSTITGCVNTGNVTAPSTCAAGIVSNLAANCKVTACYNTGAIKAGGNYPAGIVGYANKSEVTNCFNLGTVTCNETFTYGSVIGIVSDANAVIKNLYYLDGSCVKGGIGSVKAEATQTATGKTAEEIANAAFVATMNTDLAEAAFMTGCTGTNHPILLWQLYTEHSFTQKIASDKLAKEATCLEPAYYYVKCDNCGTVNTNLTVAVGDPLGHDLKETVVKAACGKEGYTEHACTRCDYNYRDTFVEALEHDYKLTASKDATCTESGSKTYTCSKCGDTYTETVEKLAHSYESVVTAPTCTEVGYTTHTCSVCGNSYIDSIVKAKGHEYESKLVAPTCDKMGYTEFTCKNCGDSYRTAYTQATEHNYTAEVTTAPTCTAEGVKTFTCADCSKTYTEPVAKLAHDYKTEVTAPTCLGYGYTTNTCKHCGYAYISAIANPTGHTEAVDAAVEATCTETGLTEGKHCSVCSEILVKQETVPAKGHTFQNGKCTVCGANNPEWVIPFKDVAENDWFFEGVKFVFQNELFNGTSADTFSPNAPMTRAMLVTVLWRLDGKTAPKAACAFTDVDATAYYADAVAWAAENGVVKGVDETHFAPEAEVTREQLAAILFRYAEKKGVDTTKRAALSTFPDADKVSNYAKDAMAWAVETGLINGIKAAKETTLAPQATAPRAQVAAILARYCESMAK